MERKHFLPTAEDPAFTPHGAIGWELGPLDGLSCYLRCVEAVLRAHRFEKPRVVNSLLQPLDLLRKRSSSSGFHAVQVEWCSGVEQNWPLVQAALSAGEPVILMPDMYYWPGHKFEKERHLFDHMVLLTHFDGTDLQMLDTDAPVEKLFMRTLSVTPSLIQSFARIGRVKIDFQAPFLSPAEVMEAMIRPNLEILAEAIADLQSLSDRWHRETISEVLARSFHVVCLGDLQPQLRLLSIALLGSGGLSKALELAAQRSMQFGLALLAEHQSVRGEPYVLSKIRLKSLVDSLAQVYLQSMACLGAPAQPLPSSLSASLPGPLIPTHLEQRLQGLASYCYGA